MLITEVGIKLIENFPVKEIMDTDYTGKLEKKLFDMEKGKYNKEDFLKEIYNFTINGAKKIKFSGKVIINDKREKVEEAIQIKQNKSSSA